MTPEEIGAAILEAPLLVPERLNPVPADFGDLMKDPYMRGQRDMRQLLFHVLTDALPTLP